MKFYITLLCLMTSATSKASQVSVTIIDLKEIQEKAAQHMFQLIADKDHRVLTNLLQCHPEIINEMPQVTIEKRTKLVNEPGFVIYARQNELSEIEHDSASALHYAITIHNHEALRILLEFGADYNLKNSGGYTPLMQSADAICTQNIQALIEAGADTEMQSLDKKTALDFAKKRSAARHLSLQDYNAEMEKYYQAIAAGKAIRDRYSREIGTIIGVKELGAIICGYAYIVFPKELQKPRKEEDWFASHCTIQ